MVAWPIGCIQTGGLVDTVKGRLYRISKWAAFNVEGNFHSKWTKPAKKWEDTLLSLGVEGSEPGVEGEEVAPYAKENVATP
ncbi:granule-bound starch synthase 1, chloroplastic/amyloplastic [Artemisia annua]|uniref:Granule-bound starch synthase 1, chloroplastic/amyloplastic n=1 Tax=Artemisia annua TaxID=35608 RepID=A0A2U1KA74_ARTAN|nr:granule-bound starch synthase 1, chloroplastic/amyloplastic [Artemisia annua]